MKYLPKISHVMYNQVQVIEFVFETVKHSAQLQHITLLRSENGILNLNITSLITLEPGTMVIILRFRTNLNLRTGSEQTNQGLEI